MNNDLNNLCYLHFSDDRLPGYCFPHYLKVYRYLLAADELKQYAHSSGRQVLFQRGY